MMSNDDNNVKITTNFVIGSDLSECSIDELQYYIIILEQEIIRTNETIDQKQNTMNAAHNLFKI